MSLESNRRIGKVDAIDSNDQPSAERFEHFIADYVRVPVEVEKTEKFMREIEIAKSLLSDYFARCGFDSTIAEFDPQNIVIFAGDETELLQYDGSYVRQKAPFKAFADAAGRIFFAQELLSLPLYRLKSLIHELTHVASFDRVRILRRRSEVNWSPERKITALSASGFRLQKELVTEKGSAAPRFAGFNEAVTERIAEHAFSGVTRFAAELSLDTSELINSGQTNGSYLRERRILQNILIGVGQHIGTGAYEYWLEIVDGYLHGHGSYLRRIDEAFGPGSLAVLAKMQPIDPSKGDSTTPDIYAEYFSPETSRERRLEIARHIKANS